LMCGPWRKASREWVPLTRDTGKGIKRGIMKI